MKIKNTIKLNTFFTNVKSILYLKDLYWFSYNSMILICTFLQQIVIYEKSTYLNIFLLNLLSYFYYII